MFCVFFFFFFFTLVTGPRRSLSLKLSDTRVYVLLLFQLGVLRFTRIEMCSGSEAGSYLRLIDLYATQL